MIRQRRSTSGQFASSAGGKTGRKRPETLVQWQGLRLEGIPRAGGAGRKLIIIPTWQGTFAKLHLFSGLIPVAVSHGTRSGGRTPELAHIAEHYRQDGSPEVF
jgi:hypothetical protein